MQIDVKQAYGLDDAAEILLPASGDDASVALTQGVVVKTGAHIRHVQNYIVQYEDTDFSGFVYHANYLKFAERGRSNFLRFAGIEHSVLFDMQPQLAFVIGRMEMDFLAPAQIDDVLLVESVYSEVRGARLVAEQRISCNGAAVWQADIVAACVDLQGKPRRLPKQLADSLLRYQGASFLRDA